MIPILGFIAAAIIYCVWLSSLENKQDKELRKLWCTRLERERKRAQEAERLRAEEQHQREEKYRVLIKQRMKEVTQLPTGVHPVVPDDDSLSREGHWSDLAARKSAVNNSRSNKSLNKLINKGNTNE